MQFAQLYQDTVNSLDQAGIDSALVEAAMLFDFCFGMSRSQLFLSGDKEVPEHDLDCFRNVLKRRLSREPLQYITETREFWSLDFVVSPSVLIPRPETEFLLECALSKQEEYNHHEGALLDMCTGSGVIAVILARELHEELIVGIDRSFDALHVAALNREKFEMTGQVHLVCSDLFSALRQDKNFKLIVANPPYIAASEIHTLEPEVREWEPHTALLGGIDGLDIIIRLADQAYKYLCPGGWLFIEIGADQQERVEKIFAQHRSRAYEQVEVVPDWSGHPRVLQARKVRNSNEQNNT